MYKLLNNTLHCHPNSSNAKDVSRTSVGLIFHNYFVVGGLNKMVNIKLCFNIVHLLNFILLVLSSLYCKTSIV